MIKFDCTISNAIAKMTDSSNSFCQLLDRFSFFYFCRDMVMISVVTNNQYKDFIVVDDFMVNHYGT